MQLTINNKEIEFKVTYGNFKKMANYLQQDTESVAYQTLMQFLSEDEPESPDGIYICIKWLSNVALTNDEISDFIDGLYESDDESAVESLSLQFRDLLLSSGFVKRATKHGFKLADDPRAQAKLSDDDKVEVERVKDFFYKLISK